MQCVCSISLQQIGKSMHRTIIVGSPRLDSRCAALAEMIYESCVEECPDDGISVISVETMSIAGCTGCDSCKAQIEPGSSRYIEPPAKGDPLMQCQLVFKSDAQEHQCVIIDDMAEARKHIDAAEELIVVSPVYFSGAPAQLKALIDRLQPYFWSNIRSRTKSRRPLTLHIVREGSGPGGFDSLVGVVESGFGVAGFKLERMFDWMGCFDDDGVVIKDAQEYVLADATSAGDQ